MGKENNAVSSMDIDIDKLDQPKFSINGTCIFVA